MNSENYISLVVDLDIGEVLSLFDKRFRMDLKLINEP